jgi:protein phosphatase PTC7
MHSLWLTGRLISRAIFNGITNLSTAADPNIQRKTDPQLVSAVCGFSKERGIQRLIKGQFGDDAWFTAKHKSADVLGQYT